MKLEISAACRQAWATTLDDWLKRSEAPLASLAKDLGNSGERNLRNWAAGTNLPQERYWKDLLALLHQWRDRQTGSPLPAVDVLDWLALLNISADQALTLASADPIRDWLAAELTQPMAWPALALPAAYVERHLTDQIVTALTGWKGYRQPERRVVVLHGPPGGGKATLAAAALRSEKLRASLRSGGQWLTTADLEWYLKTGPSFPQMEDNLNPHQRWWQWVSGPQTAGLIILEDISDSTLLNQLLRRIGAQVRLLITVQNRADLDSVLTGNLGQDEIQYFQVDGLTEREAESLADKLGPQPPDDLERPYLQKIIRQINHPEPLRFLIAQAQEVGWEPIWEWVWEARDHETPLMKTWEQLWSQGWQRLRPVEQTWLQQLAMAAEHGSSFGPYYAACVWNVKETAATERLRLLERGGWIEPIDELRHGTPSNLATWLGSQRYRLPREGWAFIRQQGGTPAASWKRHLWGLQLERRFQQAIQVPWTQSLRAVVTAYGAQALGLAAPKLPKLWRPMHHHLPRDFTRSEMGRKMPQLLGWVAVGLQIAGGVVTYRQIIQMKFPTDWLLNLWKQQGIWPPEEIWLMYDLRRPLNDLPFYLACLGLIFPDLTLKNTLAASAVWTHASTCGWQETIAAEYEPTQSPPITQES